MVALVNYTCTSFLKINPRKAASAETPKLLFRCLYILDLQITSILLMKIEETLREPENMRKVQKLIVQRTMLYETHPDFIL